MAQLSHGQNYWLVVLMPGRCIIGVSALLCPYFGVRHWVIWNVLLLGRLVSWNSLLRGTWLGHTVMLEILLYFHMGRSVIRTLIFGNLRQ